MAETYDPHKGVLVAEMLGDYDDIKARCTSGLKRILMA
jgi:hypothetical protein